ncbi:hypothetical protein B0H11DRAFT_2214236 [Mycena galericulata]|nr:hypothetical protein B0H11DRAFT_2214236 [Mycena galericulata]
MSDASAEDTVSFDEQLNNDTESSKFESTSEQLPLSPLDQQRMRLWILTQKDRPIPSLESMKKFLDLPEDDSLNWRLRELHEHHEEDLDRLYLAQSEDYLDDLADLYASYDEKAPEPEDVEQWYSINRTGDCHPSRVQHEWNYILHHTNTTYKSRLAELTRNGESDFPQSVVDYRSKPKDVQHRIARFLLLESDDQKEEMLSQYNWDWRQVLSLSEEFQTDTVRSLQWHLLFLI